MPLPEGFWWKFEWYLPFNLKIANGTTGIKITSWYDVLSGHFKLYSLCLFSKYKLYIYSTHTHVHTCGYLGEEEMEKHNAYT